jgi:hypothetical protein
MFLRGGVADGGPQVSMMPVLDTLEHLARCPAWQQYRPLLDQWRPVVTRQQMSFSPAQQAHRGVTHATDILQKAAHGAAVVRRQIEEGFKLHPLQHLSADCSQRHS